MIFDFRYAMMVIASPAAAAADELSSPDADTFAAALIQALFLHQSMSRNIASSARPPLPH